MPARGRLSRLGLLLGAALPIVLQQSVSWSAPADITTMAAPMLGADPPAARDVAAGDASVSTQNGSLSYSYPIAESSPRFQMTPKTSRKIA